MIVNELKELRRSRGFSQQALMLASGVSTATIVLIERYGQVPGADVRRRIARALGVEESEIWQEVVHD